MLPAFFKFSLMPYIPMYNCWFRICKVRYKHDKTDHTNTITNRKLDKLHHALTVTTAVTYPYRF